MPTLRCAKLIEKETIQVFWLNSDESLKNLLERVPGVVPIDFREYQRLIYLVDETTFRALDHPIVGTVRTVRRE